MNFHAQYLREHGGACFAPVVAVLPYLAAAAAVTGAGAEVVAGEQQQAASNYNAQVAQVNAEEADSADAVKAQQQQRLNEQNLGQVASAIAGGGVDNSGSPLLQMMDTARQGTLQKQLLLWQGQTALASGQSAANIATATGSAEATTGVAKAGTTLLTGAEDYYKNNVPAVTPGSTGTSPLTVPGSTGTSFNFFP